MKLSDAIEFHSTSEYGIVVECTDAEMADCLDDFLTEHCDEKSSIKFEDGKVSFFLDRKISVDKAEGLLRRFLDAYK